MLQTRRLLAAFAFLLVASLPGSAQDASGKITGIVTDQTGATVPNAQVTVTNTATNINQQITTNKDGFYQALQLPIGLYRVTVESAWL